MSIPHLTPTFSDIKTWVRSATLSVNRLISGKQDKNDNLTSIAGLSLTGNSGEVIAVKATEDGFELVAAGGGGSLTDGDKGDITVSGSGATWTIDNDVVTYAKMQNVSATSRILGRITAGAGDTEELTAANVKTILSLAQSDISGLTTADSPQFTAINLGHASDTTLTRSGAGDVTIEGNAVYRAGGTDVPVTDGGTGASTASGARTNLGLVIGTDVPASGVLIGAQVITATGAGTYTPASGTKAIIIELVGGGGGGGGVPQPTGSNGATAAAGAGGAYLRKRLTSAFSGASYSVGAKGTGGSPGNNAGSAGGDTTFTATGGGGTVYTAAGGSGGAGNAGGSVPRISGTAGGGTATNGDIGISGGSAQRGIVIATTHGLGSVGGISPFAMAQVASQVAAANSSSAGSNALGKGGGGSGAIAVGTGAAQAGGDGTDGIIIVWEYS